ncbi:hypothetical protein [Pedobacter duraquae]|uniref:30S ribosomal protein S10 n=1 Tax=Pedobacter duraquae TaxID=425511 RepID=A0A4V3C3E6_9SPHI|nr:hypothetical protein [Pedobacter duraquae]TDO21758.1 hypothetical protein CLV32_2866 [Pedobacter duraquae]
MKKLILPILTLFIFNSSTILAQVPAPRPVVIADSAKIDPSLQGQYQLLLAKSKTLNGYKLVNPARLSSLWNNAKDSLRISRRLVQTNNAKISSQEAEITALKAQIAGKDNSIATSNAKVNDITFMGMSFEKGTYNTIVWSLIIILALALAIVIVRSAKFIQEAKYRSNLYEEISTEYQNYKVKANDKEKKLARELQDERNKLDELKNR